MNKKRLVVFFITILTLVGCVCGFSKAAIDHMNLGLDLRGGFEILYKIDPLKKGDKVDMAAVSSAVSKRVDILGVSEPNITVEGKNRIRVQLAGVKNNNEARKMISSNAVLTFRDTNDKLLMDSSVLKDGGASLGHQNGRPIVQIKIANTQKFYEVTQKLSQQQNNQMVIWLDYKKGQSYAAESAKEQKGKKPAYVSAASVSEGLNSDTVQITGNFTDEEAQNLADLLNSGSLNFKMKELYSNVVSPELGEGSFDKTIIAGALGIIGIMALLIIMYRVPGIIASVAVAAYTLATLWLYNSLGGVFTLSGIAALVLGVGMAVDSSVITMERIKESLYQGRSVRQAFKEGTHKSLSTIMDSQLTTLISAIILYAFGTGSVKGFATMLMISTILTILFNVTIVRFLLGNLVNSGYLDKHKKWFGVKLEDIPNLNKGEKARHKNFLSNFDFVGKAKYAIAVSITIFVLGLGFAGFNGVKNHSLLNLGIEFSSGSKITMIDSHSKLNENELEKDLKSCGIKADKITVSGSDKKTANIEINKAISENASKKANALLSKKYNASVSESTVSPVVGRELVKNAIIMSLLSWLAILIYVSIRFQFDYAISGIVALVHDVLIILSVFAIFRLEVNTDIIAVLLTIIGYSINDSIVCFDRIRENVKAYGNKHIKDEEYKEIVNSSLQETIVRSLVTSVTTMIPVICLLFFGSQSIFTFNVALLVGLIAGTNSSVFIAAQLWLYLRRKIKPKNKPKKRLKKVDEIEEHIIPGIND